MLKEQKEIAEERARKCQAMMDNLKLIYQCDFDKLNISLGSPTPVMAAIEHLTELEQLLNDKKSD
jgi:hypothetical protein